MAVAHARAHLVPPAGRRIGEVGLAAVSVLLGRLLAAGSPGAVLPGIGARVGARAGGACGRPGRIGMRRRREGRRTAATTATAVPRVVVHARLASVGVTALRLGSPSVAVPEPIETRIPAGATDAPGRGLRPERAGRLTRAAVLGRLQGHAAEALRAPVGPGTAAGCRVGAGAAPRSTGADPDAPVRRGARAGLGAGLSAVRRIGLVGWAADVWLAWTECSTQADAASCHAPSLRRIGHAAGAPGPLSAPDGERELPVGRGCSVRHLDQERGRRAHQLERDAAQSSRARLDREPRQLRREDRQAPGERAGAALELEDDPLLLVAESHHGRRQRRGPDAQILPRAARPGIHRAAGHEQHGG